MNIGKPVLRISREKSVGFTASRTGLAPKQRKELESRLRQLHSRGFKYFHHGHCPTQLGDIEGARIAKAIGFFIVCHPPADGSHSACDADYAYSVFPYLVRNRHIVDDSTVLLACPKTKWEELRSGTWAAIRYARSLGMEPMIL